MKRILLIEDDKDLNKGLVYDLEMHDYRCISSFSLSEGMLYLEENKVDLILLDGTLPDGDGFDFCRQVKKEKETAVIFLTARDMEQDELQGFDCGADDYITKPFHMPILRRRIEAALRKTGWQEQRRENSVYRDDALLIDFENLQARLNGRELLLTPTEFRILRLMTVNRTVTKQLLLEKIWDTSGNFVDEHTVAVNINRLRKKLEGSGHEYIKTVYGMGYQWRGWKYEAGYGIDCGGNPAGSCFDHTFARRAGDAFDKKNLTEYSRKLSYTLDRMISGDKEIAFEEEKETLIGRIQVKMRQVYEIMQAQADQRWEEKKQMEEIVSDISHQVKTPIANLRMYHELAAQEPEKAGEFMEAEERQIDKLEFLMKTMIKMSRLETGLIEVKPLKNKVYDLIFRAVCTIALKAEKKR